MAFYAELQSKNRLCELAEQGRWGEELQEQREQRGKGVLKKNTEYSGFWLLAPEFYLDKPLTTNY
jgi:hypothetical protein